MQTFLPYTDSFERIARELDNKRLHKQTLEGWQVLLALTKLNPAGEHRDPKGWVNHPVAVMWRGHEKLLVSYLAATYYEWRSRGFNSTMLPKIFSTYDKALELGRIQYQCSIQGGERRSRYARRTSARGGRRCETAGSSQIQFALTAVQLEKRCTM